MMESTPIPLSLLRKLRLSGERSVSLTGEIGRGSLGTVYAGTLSAVGVARRNVAVKIVDDLPGDDDARLLAGISRALDAAACICDPRIVQVYDYELFGVREPFIVTELVDGGSLEILIDGFERQDRQLPQDVAILIGLKVAEALEVARTSRLPDGRMVNLVHGSLSARDVLVSWGGEVKVKGLGMWQAVLGASMQRPTGALARLEGTAPEVARGQAPDTRSDVFALGMLLRRMLLGQRFSPHTSPAEAVRLVYDGVVHGGLQERALLAPLRGILRRATAANPAERYATTGEVAFELRRIATLMGIPDVPAFIAHAVADAFAPEISRREAERAFEEAHVVPPVVASVLDVRGHELFAYGDVVEVSPRYLSAPPLNDTETPPARARFSTTLTMPTAILRSPAPDDDAHAEVADDELVWGDATIEPTPPRSFPLGLRVMPTSPPRPALRPLRPRQQSGIDFRTTTDLDDAPTIVSGTPDFDDVL